MSNRTTHKPKAISLLLILTLLLNPFIGLVLAYASSEDGGDEPQVATQGTADVTSVEDAGDPEEENTATTGTTSTSETTSTTDPTATPGTTVEPNHNSTEIKTAPAISLFAATPTNTPAKIVADNHVVMLRADGRLLVWGDNTYGQLGLGSGSAQKVYTPTENTFFSDNGLRIKDIAVVEDATFVLCSNGELYSFGKGLNGRLGGGGTANISTPTLIAGSQAMRIDKLYPGKEFIVALSDDNCLYAWGRNNKGQCGNGTKIDVMTPTKIPNMDNADVKHLPVGDDYVLLIKQDNTFWGWGNTSSGQMPYDSEYIVGTVSTAHVYGGVGSSSIKPDTLANAPATGTIKSYYITDNASEYTTPSRIGINARLVLGHLISNLTSYSKSSELSININGAICPSGNLINNSYFSECSVYYKYSLVWDNGNRSLTATTSWPESPVTMNFANPADIAKISHIQAGRAHGYFTHDGKIYSFGDNTLKQQASDYVTDGALSKAASINNFISTLESGEGFSELVVAHDTNYILSGTGNVYVWGGNQSGKAGTGSGASYIDTPTAITGLNGKSIAKIVLGRNTTYFISHTGDVYATGDNLYGQSGLGEAYKDESKVTTPEQITTFKFAENATPPDAPSSVNTPDEVEAGTNITINWDTVDSAVEYELVRYVTPKDGSVMLMAASSSSELLYNGDQNTYTDTALDTWNNVTYGLKAKNFIGDSSQEALSNTITVLAATSGGNNNNSNNSANNGLSNDNLAAILAAIAAGSKKSSVTINNPDSNNDWVKVLLAELAKNGETGNVVGLPDTNIYNQGASIKDLAAILGELTPQPQVQQPNATDGLIKDMVTVMLLKMINTDDTPTTANIQAPPVYVMQQPQKTSSKTVNVVVAAAMLLTLIASAILSLIPEAKEQEGD